MQSALDTAKSIADQGYSARVIFKQHGVFEQEEELWSSDLPKNK
jgi:hypothetical protein